MIRIKDKRGLTFFYTLMLGLTIIVLGIALATPIKQVIDISMNNLTCTVPDTDWTQALCWILDILKPTFTGLFIFIGFAILFARSYMEK